MIQQLKRVVICLFFSGAVCAQDSSMVFKTDLNIYGYDSLRLELNKEFKELRKTASIDQNIDSLGNYLSELIVNRLIPYWYGTTWDFNGISEKPGRGEIACGYFVSTLLKHAGFNVERYRLAQQAASSIVKSVCPDSAQRRWFWNKNSDQFLKEFKEMEKGLYVIGFDYHVGFILNKQEEVLLLHSAYYGPVCVVNEQASKAYALDNTNNYVVGKVMNKELLSKWVSAEKVETIKN